MKSVGGVLPIRWNCSIGHNGFWHSPSILGKIQIKTNRAGFKTHPPAFGLGRVKRKHSVFATPFLTAAAVLMTGTNFEKIQVMMKLCNILI